MTVLEYANKFNQLGHFCPRLLQEESIKVHWFEQGLRPLIRSGLIPLMLSNYKDILERALKIEIDIQRTESRRDNHKRPKSGESPNPQSKKARDNGEQKEAATCNYCGRLHGGVCYKKTGACYACGKMGYLAYECPTTKDSSGPQVLQNMSWR